MTGRQIRFWLGALAGLGFLLFVFKPILLPFVAGIAVAYFIDPVVDRLEDVGLRRWIATAVVVSIFFALVGLALFILTPLVRDQVLGFAQRMPGYAGDIRNNIQPLIDRIARDLGDSQAQEIHAAAARIMDGMIGGLGDLLVNILSGGKALFNLISLVLITPVVTFFLIRDWDLMVARIDTWLPRRHAATIRRQFANIDAALAGFVRGQALVAMTLGTLYAIGWTLTGLDFGLALGLMTGLLAFVPYAGALLGGLTAIAVAFGQFWPDVTSILMVGGVFVVVQSLDAAFITPRLIGGRVGLHPVWVLFALFAGANLLGFLGVLVAVPSAAVIGVLARYALQRYLGSRYFLDQPDLPLVPPPTGGGSGKDR